MNILITGNAGFLGSRLTDWILQNIESAHVVGIDNLSGGYKENIDRRVEFYNLDLSTDDFDYIFDTVKPAYVFHFAAYAAECLSPYIRSFNYTNNLISTARIINSCIKHKVRRLIFSSSIAVYGQIDDKFKEDMVCNPKDCYGVAKLACEMDIKIAGDQHGLDWTILRPHNIIGIKQNIFDKYRNVIGIWMYNKLHNQPFTIYGDGQQTRAFSIVDDMLECIWKSAILPQASKEIINLGGTIEYSINEIAHILQKIVGGSEIQYLEPRYEVKTSIPSYEKSIKILDYQDRISLTKGLTDMWEWAKTLKDKPQFVWPKYELNEGIYSYWKLN